MNALHRLLRILGLAAVAIIVTSPSAAAHGLSRNAVELDPLGFLTLGIQHMLLGWDHLLFIMGVLLWAKSWQVAAKLITVFVLGHSLTLILATQLGWQVNATFVDAVIGVSVLLVGLLLVMKWQISPSVALAVVGTFGLIHGLGLATRVLALGLPQQGLLGKVLAFNVGVEIGQLIAILAMVVLGQLGSRLIRGGAKAPLGALIVAGGIIALTIASYRLAVPRVGAPTEFEPPAAGSCRVVPFRGELLAGPQAAEKTFYGPEETPLESEFVHNLTDGYLAIYYPPGTPGSELDELRRYLASDDGKGVIAGPHTRTDYVVQSYHELLVCEEWDKDTVNAFAEEWFATL
jgi:hydrogenase/urease accessory protein HupE